MACNSLVPNCAGRSSFGLDGAGANLPFPSSIMQEGGLPATYDRDQDSAFVICLVCVLHVGLECSTGRFHENLSGSVSESVSDMYHMISYVSWIIHEAADCVHHGWSGMGRERSGWDGWADGWGGDVWDGIGMELG